jgi:protein-disulfide isomerase
MIWCWIWKYSLYERTFIALPAALVQMVCRCLDLNDFDDSMAAMAKEHGPGSPVRERSMGESAVIENSARQKVAAARRAQAVGEGSLAIPYGASRPAKVTLTIYEDFRCPYCRMAESAFESTYKAYVQSGDVAVQYHLVDLLDRNLGGTGSIRAGNAGACAQDAGKFEAFHDVLYADQSEEADDAYGSNAVLFSLADQVPGLDTPAFRACVNAGTHGSWVKRNYDSLDRLLNGSVATPYYAINGTQYKMTGQSVADQQAAFKAALGSAIAAG